MSSMPGQRTRRLSQQSELSQGCAGAIADIVVIILPLTLASLAITSAGQTPPQLYVYLLKKQRAEQQSRDRAS